MEPFKRSPEYNKMLSYREEIQQVLYPWCGLMDVRMVGGGAEVASAVGFPAKGGESVTTCAVIWFFQLLHADSVVQT